MPRRTSAEGRRPTAEDLEGTQLAIYQALPTSLQIQFLDMLPRITVTAADLKKADTIRERARLLDSVAVQLRAQVQDLNRLADRASKGEKVDLKAVLQPPTVNGVVLRVTRGAKG
jgi:hypothetical protein